MRKWTHGLLAVLGLLALIGGAAWSWFHPWPSLAGAPKEWRLVVGMQGATVILTTTEPTCREAIRKVAANPGRPVQIKANNNPAVQKEIDKGGRPRYVACIYGAATNRDMLSDTIDQYVYPKEVGI